MDVDSSNDAYIEEYERARNTLATSNWSHGLQQLEQLAHRGSITSILLVADEMRKGQLYNQDLPGAEAWYKVAVDSGSARGLFGLGLTYLLMGRSSEAIQYLESAIARDYAPAYNALAGIYFRGDGVLIDRQKARDLWRGGACRGHLPAKKNLLHQSLHGRYGIWGRIVALMNLLPVVLEISVIKVTSPYSDRLR